MDTKHYLFLLGLLINSVQEICCQTHDDNVCPLDNCTSTNCGLPACQCVGFIPPQDIEPKWAPQFILFTFNKVVKTEFYDPFKKIFTKNRRNPSGLRISSTLFVSDKDGERDSITTDYCLVRKLFEAGQEIASNSATHRSPMDWWRSKATVNDWEEELDGQRKNLTESAELPADHVSGARAPRLYAGGDLQFRAMYSAESISYDSSLVLKTIGDDYYWPFSMTYNDGLPCEGTAGICPRNCYPSLWEVPVQQLKGPKGTKCIHLDYCVADSDKNTIYATLMSNWFMRRNTQKAPLVISINNQWFERNENVVDGLTRFIDRVLEEDDVFIVSISQMLAWMKDPKPLNRLNEVPELYSMEERKENPCNAERGTVSSQTFFIQGTTLVVVEILFLGLLLLYLIAKDMD